MARKRLGEILIEASVIDEPKLHQALAEQQRQGGTLGQILVGMGLCTEEELVKALAQQLNIQTVHLEARPISGSALDLIPIDFCERNVLIPFRFDGSYLDVAMADPTNLSAVVDLRNRLGLNVRVFLAGPTSVERALARVYRGQQEPASAGPKPSASVVISARPRTGAPPSSPTTPSPSFPTPLAVMRPKAATQTVRTSPPAGPAAPVANPNNGGAAPLAKRERSPSQRAGGPATAGSVQAGASVSAPGAPQPSEDTVDIGQLELDPADLARASSDLPPLPQSPAPPEGDPYQMIAILTQRVGQLEALALRLESLVSRDEDVLRKLMGLLVEKGLCSRQEILEWIK